MQPNPFEPLLASFSQAMEERIICEVLKRLESQRETEEKQKNTENDYLTIEELCELTKLKKSTIYAKRSRRELPAYKFGRELRFKRSEVDAWIRSKQLTCLENREGGEG